MNVLIIGSGARVEEELSMIDRSVFDVVVGVNRAAVHFGPVDVHCTLHPEVYAPSQGAPKLVSNKRAKGVHEVISSLWWPGGDSGSSGLFAVKYALERLDADFVVLAGVGIDEGPHYYNPSLWHAARRFQSTWIRVKPQLLGRVYSLGGWTAELLNGAFENQPPVLPVFVAGRSSGHINQKEIHHV